jgi:hypothetical protein
MSEQLHEDVISTIAEFQRDIESKLSDWLKLQTPTAFRETELLVAEKCRRLQDGIIAALILAIVTNADFEAKTYVAASQTKHLRYGERRGKTIKLLGGEKIRLEGLIYLKPNNRGKMNKKKGKKHRAKKNGVGLFPALSALGVEFGVTPALGGEIARQVTDSDSVRAGRSSLSRRGIDFGHKQTLLIVNAFSARAVQQRNQWLESVRRGEARTGLLKGQKVAVSTDGGRTRHRHYRPGKRKANGHRNYDAPWQEPKLLTIYVFNTKGEIDSTFCPIYDGTLKDCEGIFEMLLGYLRALGIHQAKELVFVADGAKWIWERVDQLIQCCGIDESKVTQVVDWYHAVEKLNTISGIPRNWRKGDKQKWIKKAKLLLYAGKSDELVEHIESLATGRRAKQVRSHKDYFVRNKIRMRYQWFIDRKIPIGSGAMESAVRRILNLRMKSNAKFWLDINAEGMIMLRSYLKAGRYDDLIDWSISKEASWWLAGLTESESNVHCLLS